MERKFINGFGISMCKYGNVFVTEIIDGFGRTVKSYTDFTMDSAKKTFSHFCYVCAKRKEA